MIESDNVRLRTGLPSRLRQAREDVAISRSELARRVGVQPSAAIQWERENGTSPSAQHLIRIAAITNVALDWLATGRGSPRLLEGTLHPDVIAGDLFEKKLLLIVRRFPERARDALMTFLDAFEKG